VGVLRFGKFNLAFLNAAKCRQTPLACDCLHLANLHGMAWHGMGPAWLGMEWARLGLAWNGPGLAWHGMGPAWLGMEWARLAWNR
jgi:hypothetical protein